MSTKAGVSGVSVSDILKQAHWSEDSTFQKFYMKDILDLSSNFQMVVLDKALNRGGLQQWSLVLSDFDEVKFGIM